MKRFIPLLALFGAGLAASLALASPPPGHGPPTSSSSTSTGPGKSGDHAPKAKCRPVNLKGTVSGGTIALHVTKAAGPNAKQFLNSDANLTINGPVSVQAWSCAAGGAATGPQTLVLRQLHVGGSPQAGTTTTTSPSTTTTP